MLTEALKVLERDPGPNDPMTGRALLNFGDLRLQQGRTEEAERLARRALAIHEAQDPRGAWSARSQLLLGRTLFAAGRFGDAEDHIKRAQAIGETAFGAQNWELSHILRFLGQVYLQTGRPAEAEPLLRRALDGFEKTVGPAHRGAINAMRVLGANQLALGDPAGAEVILRRAVPLAEKVGGSRGTDNVTLTYLYLSLADAIRRQGRAEEAGELHKASLKAAEGIGKEGPYAIAALTGLGRHHLSAGHFDDARATLQQALGLAETNAAEGLQVAFCLRWLADVELQAKRPAEALAYLKRLAALLDARRGNARVLVGDRFNNDIAPLLRWTALAFAHAGWHLEKGHGPIAGEAFVGAQHESQSTAAAAISQTANRFAAANDALGALVREGQDLLQRWRGIDEQLTATLQEGAGNEIRRALRSELDTLNKELVRVGARIAAEFPQYASLARPRPLAVSEVQKLVGPDDAILVYLVGDRGSFVWALSQNGFAWERLPLDTKTLGEKVVRMRRGLDVVELQKGAEAGQVQLFDLQLAHELYGQLVGPVASALHGKRNIFVVPSGPLTSLPFHLLLTEAPARPITDLKQIPEYADAPWIIKRHAITMLPSVPSLKAMREIAGRASAEKPLIGYGDPAFEPGKPAGEGTTPRKPATRSAHAYTAYWKGSKIDVEALAKGLEALPETAEELRGIANALAASAEDIHLRAAASETAVKKADLSRYRVVYFATHGLVAGEVSGLGEPALALAMPAVATEEDNGLLTASEVALLKLNADWVVLSACNTAAGGKAGAEAFSGLAQAFFYAGARTLLVSHWSVDSAAAVKLTTRAFEAIKGDPAMGRAEALRRSMLAFMGDRSDPLNAYPAFWAPFALVGDGG